MFPIAMDAADQTGADSKLMAYNLMLAASASFMSPFGYTTNLLIYGPGERDFVCVLNAVCSLASHYHTDTHVSPRKAVTRSKILCIWELLCRLYCGY